MLYRYTGDTRATKGLCAMRDNPALRWGAAAIAVGGVLLVALAFHSGTMARLWKLYNEQALWAQGMGFSFLTSLIRRRFPHILEPAAPGSA